jgi:hypothetical protein
MDDSDRPLNGIIEKNRQAIGGKDPQGNPRSTGEENIPLQPPDLIDLLPVSLKEDDSISVDLAEREEGINFFFYLNRLSPPVCAGGFSPTFLPRPEAMDNPSVPFPCFNLQKPRPYH